MAIKCTGAYRRRLDVIPGLTGDLLFIYSVPLHQQKL